MGEIIRKKEKSPDSKSTSQKTESNSVFYAVTLLSSKFPLILKIPPFSYSPCPGHRLTRRMQRFTNQFVSRCSPFPYCESDSALVSSPVGAFFIGLGKHLCCFPKSCSNACSSPSFKVVTGYPLTGHPRVFSCQGTWAKLPAGRKKGMTTAW